MDSTPTVSDPATTRTSVRARWCVGASLGGYLAVAVVAALPNSPLTVLLPAGASPPGWAARLARAVALDMAGRSALVAVAIVLIAVLVAAFAGVCVEAVAGRVAVRFVLAAAGLAVALAVAAPLLLSRDVATYADAGRIAAIHHLNPYAVPLRALPRDPFVRVTSAQWLPHHTVYGPAFTLLSEAIVRVWRSPGAVILAFKVLAGLGIAVAVVCAWGAARMFRQERAPLAVALIGLNPVVIVHTVGGGHVDAILAGLLAAALLLAVRAKPGDERGAFGVTVLLTLACLVKIVLVPALALWVWWLARSSGPRARRRAVALHVVVIAALTVALVIPYLHGVRTLTAIGSVGGLESWASPAHLVAHAAQALVRSIAGATAGKAADAVVIAAFLLTYAVLFVRIVRRERAIADAWGTALLLLVLSLPFVLPWYACWFLPFLALLRDGLLTRIGVAVSLVLALTLVPADPFHGFTTPGVMGFVHYVAAPALLALLVVAARIVWSRRYPESDGAIDAAV